MAIAHEDWSLPLVTPTSPFTMSFPTDHFDEALGEYNPEDSQTYIPDFDFFNGESATGDTFDSYPFETPLAMANITCNDMWNDDDGGLPASIGVFERQDPQEDIITSLNTNDNNGSNVATNTSEVHRTHNDDLTTSNANDASGMTAISKGPSNHDAQVKESDLSHSSKVSGFCEADDASVQPGNPNDDTRAPEIDNHSGLIAPSEISGHEDAQKSNMFPFSAEHWDPFDDPAYNFLPTDGHSGEFFAVDSGANRSSSEASDTVLSNSPKLSDVADNSEIGGDMRTMDQVSNVDQLQRSSSVAAPSSTMMAGRAQNFNGDRRNLGRLSTDNQLQHQSNSTSAHSGTMMGASAQMAIDLISPVAPESGDDKDLSWPSAELTSAMSRQSSNESCLPSNHGSNDSLRHQGSPAAFQQPQQSLRRLQSGLRHMSVPGQLEARSEDSLSNQAPLRQNLMHSAGNFSMMQSTPSSGRRKPYTMTASNVQFPYIQDYENNNDGADMDFYMDDVADLGPEFGGVRVNHFPSHSRTSDKQSSQHSLIDSPQTSLGNHRDTTQKPFQPPQQQSKLTSNQILGYQHLYNRYTLPSPQQAHHSSMKHENSSPESASAVLNKIKQTPTHGSRRVSNVASSQPPNFDSSDQQRIRALANAMLDMSQPEDNEGMLKTWRGLMKESDKIQQVCEKVLKTCYQLEQQGRPLQHAIKTQNHYDNLNHRVREICNAFKTQKTMCKHLMEAPYLFQVVDDPILAANRVVNNRKVNKGKKAAIEAGREALKAVNPQQAAEEISEIGDNTHNDEDDADGEEDDEYSQFALNIQSTMSPGVARGSTAMKRNKSNASREGSVPKKAKRGGNSRYQVNEEGVMVDTGAKYTRRTPQAGSPSPMVNRPSGSHSRLTTYNDFMDSSNELAFEDNTTNEHPIHDVQGGLHGSGNYANGYYGPHLGGYPRRH